MSTPHVEGTALSEPKIEVGAAASLRWDDARRYTVHTVVALALLFGFVLTLAHFFKDDLQLLGNQFVTHFGIGGMFFGTLLADSVHFPVPPQFYMLTAITSGISQHWALTAIAIGSLVGGTFSYGTGRFLGGRALFDRLVARVRPRIDPLFQRYGYLALAVGSVSPVPFSTLCLVGGVYRMPYRHFAFFSLLRIPRLLLFYAVIRAGWM